MYFHPLQEEINNMSEEVKELSVEKLREVFGHQPKKLIKIQSHFNQLVECRKELDALVIKSYKEAIFFSFT